MSEKHTPGPWHDDGYRIYGPTEEEDKRRGRMIVEYKHVDDFNDADAALIAAAPDLLAACKAVLAANGLFTLPDYVHDPDTEWEKAINMMIAATKKAEDMT